MNLSGLVAILEGGAVKELRDLGPTLVACKPGLVLPVIEDKPDLGPNQAYGEPQLEIAATEVTRHWPVLDLGPADFPLSARQIRLGLIAAGISLGVVQATISAIADQTQREIAQVWWEYTDPVLWDHPVRAQLTALLGITEADAKAMWMAEKDIPA